jgi:hypothetical protein
MSVFSAPSQLGAANGRIDNDRLVWLESVADDRHLDSGATDTQISADFDQKSFTHLWGQTAKGPLSPVPDLSACFPTAGNNFPAKQLAVISCPPTSGHSPTTKLCDISGIARFLFSVQRQRSGGFCKSCK